MKSLVIKSTLLGLFLTLFSTSIQASHYMGGEITWECLANGKYVFYLKTFRECAGVAYGSLQTLNSNSPVGSIALSLVAGYPKDISPVCNSNSNYIHLSCSSATVPNTGSVSIYLYKSNEVTLNGTPPASGWMFYWGSCCRNPSTNGANSTSVSWRIMSVMYPYGTQSAYPCYDNSPAYAAPPAMSLSTGFNSICGFTAVDKDNDDIIYNWASSLTSAGTAMPYNNGYSYSSPLPNSSMNSNNVAAELDTTTGIITFTSYTTGAFITKVKATSYRHGIKIAEVSRENVIIIKSDTNLAPSFSLVSAPNKQIITDTVLVGDTVSYSIGASDIQALPYSSFQTVFLDKYGNEFGSYVPASGGNQATLNANSGCVHPPCATLTPAWDTVAASGAVSTLTNFNWVTSFSQLDSSSSGYHAKTYNFYFYSHDDYCPVPAQRSLVLSIYLTTGNIFQKPEIHCIETKINGDVELKFNPVRDIMNSFENYYIYTATNKSGPYTLIDSISNVNTGTYTHIGAGADSLRRYYLVAVKSYSNIANFTHKEFSDTISTINLSVQKNGICGRYLQWTEPYFISPATYTNQYIIHRRTQIGSWITLDTVNTTFYNDTVNLNGMPNYYRISMISHGLKDSTGASLSCESWGNICISPTQSLQNYKIPIRCVNVLQNGDVKLTWNLYNDPNSGFMFYKIFSSTNKNGPFSPVGQVNKHSTCTFTHSGAGADIQKRYYYLKVYTHDCLGSIVKVAEFDTVSTMAINGHITSPNKVTLTWNPIRDQAIPTSSGTYFIYQRIFPGNWILIDTTKSLLYHATITVSGTQYCVSNRNTDLGQSITSTEGFSSPTEIYYLGISNQGKASFSVSQNIPNPFDKTTLIRFESTMNQDIQFIVYDNGGRIIKEETIQAEKGKNSIQFSRAGLSSGLYFYTLNNGKNSITKTFVIK